MAQFLLDPDARLDFTFVWTPWLAEGETISSHTVTGTAGVTVESSSEAGGVVTVWLHNGVVDTNPTVTCHIATSAGRQDDRSINIRVRQR